MLTPADAAAILAALARPSPQASDAMIEAGYCAMMRCKPMLSTDDEREACEAIYLAMSALAEPRVPSEAEQMLCSDCGWRGATSTWREKCKGVPCQLNAALQHGKGGGE